MYEYGEGVPKTAQKQRGGSRAAAEQGYADTNESALCTTMVLIQENS
jgi:hypothetical protein